MKMHSRFLFITLALLLINDICRAQYRDNLADLTDKLSAAKTDTEKVMLNLRLGRFYLNKRGEFQSDLDSALLFARTAGLISSRIKYYRGIGSVILLESQIFRERGDKNRAWELMNQAYNYFSGHRMAKETAEADIAYCSFFDNSDDGLDKKISYSEHALALFRKSGSIYETATDLKSLGDYYQIKNQWDLAIKDLEESLDLYTRIGYKDIQGACDLLGYVYCKKGNNILALKYGLLALKTAEAVKDTSPQLCTIYNRLAVTYYVMKKNDLAYRSYSNALLVAQHYHDVDAITQIEFNLAVLLRRLNRPAMSLKQLQTLIRSYPPKTKEQDVTAKYLFAQLYLDLKQPGKAKYYVDTLIKMQSENPYDESFGTFYDKAAIRYFYETRQYPLVYKYLINNDSLLNYNHNSKQENELQWANVDSATGDFKSALKHYKLYKTETDSVQSKSLKKQLAELQFQFDVDHKDQHIKFLTQQDLLQKNQIKSETTLRYVFIGGLAIMLLFAGFAFNGYRLKKISNAKLTMQQEEINQKNNMLQSLLGEKDWLLKEIHHRVKNNLQIVISLLNTQSAYLESEDAISAIQNSQQRMYTISLIHQKLYQSNNLSTIDIPVYIRELVDYLQECFKTEKKIEYILDLIPLKLDVTQAVPLGLILNEAISNAVKYAFNDLRDAQIKIKMEQMQDGYIHLCIMDNGRGLPIGYDHENSSSLGMSLMQGLALQLEGEFNLLSKNGLCICIKFKNNISGSLNVTAA